MNTAGSTEIVSRCSTELTMTRSLATPPAGPIRLRRVTVAADTFLVAWRRLADVPRDPDAVRLWLYGVARRTLANSERSRGRSDRVAAKLIATAEPIGLAPDLADGVVERARIREALGMLSEVDQEALRLVAWEGLDLAGAAKVMGCSRSTMTVRMHRARSRMARALSQVEHVEIGHVPSRLGQTEFVEEVR